MIKKLKRDTIKNNLLDDNVAQFAARTIRHIITNHTHYNTAEHNDYGMFTFLNIHISYDCKIQLNTINNTNKITDHWNQELAFRQLLPQGKVHFQVLHKFRWSENRSLKQHTKSRNATESSNVWKWLESFNRVLPTYTQHLTVLRRLKPSPK